MGQTQAQYQVLIKGVLDLFLLCVLLEEHTFSITVIYVHLFIIEKIHTEIKLRPIVQLTVQFLCVSTSEIRL